MFTHYPTYSPYRTLFLTSPIQMGEDVYALQTALIECGYAPGTPDGQLGSKTRAAILAAQKEFALKADGDRDDSRSFAGSASRSPTRATRARIGISIG
jgi:peptidoglycan hydrolase-like protein with peptidoglycan-binding domain